MIKKISVAEFEVIHFTTEDVIVTSGTGSLTAQSYSSLSQERTYFALGDEMAEDSQLSGTRFKNGLLFYKFNLDSSNSIHILNSGGHYTIGAVDAVNNYYAWYDGGWLTEHKTKEYYIASGVWAR